MQINNVVNLQNIQHKQNFKGSSAISNLLLNYAGHQQVPLNVSKAYASPQFTKDYREIETFEVPYIGKGKLYELKNGHRIILVPKFGQTNMHTYVGVGSNNEQTNLKETSHLLEHLVSDYCTNPKNNQTKSILDKISANHNAFTSQYFTSYYIDALITNNKDFEDLVEIHAQTVNNKDFTDEQIEKEKNIIIQELDSRGKFDTNYLLAERLAAQNLFNLDDSSDIVATSSVSTIKSIKKVDLIDYYKTFYRPDNMVTTIIGNVNDDSIKTIAKYFNSKNQPQIHAQNIDYPKFNVDNTIQKTSREDVQSPNKDDTKAYVDLAFVGPTTADNKDSAFIEVLDWIINKRINDYSSNNDNKLEMRFTTDQISSDKLVPIILRLRGDSYNDDVEDNLKTIYSILFELTQKPISEEELKLSKEKIKADWTYFAEDSFFLSLALSEQAMLSGDLDREKDFKKIDSVTVQDIQNTAKKYIDLNKASLVVVHPQVKNENSKKANGISFKGNIDQLDTKDIHEYLLPNNLRVIIDSRPGISRSTIKFNLNSKKILYNNPDAAWFLACLLTSKSTRNDLDKESISLTRTANTQSLALTMNAPADKSLKMLRSSVEAILHPDLNKEEFESIKTSRMIVEDLDENPSSKRLNDEFFKDDLYSYRKGDVNGLELDDVKMVHQQILKNAQGTVFLTIPKDELLKNEGEIFQSLMKLPTLKPYDYNTFFNKHRSQPLEKNKIFVEENDSTQIKVEKIFKIIESGNIKDFAGLMLLDLMLGGDEQSKLFKKLRSQHNIAYSAYSQLRKDYTPDLAHITLSTTVSANNKDNLHTVISEFDKSINELVAEPISEEDLTRAKIKVKSSFIKSLERSSDRNNSISENYNSFYGIGYQQALFDAIDNMTPDFLQSLAKYYFTKPYLMKLDCNKDVIESNKDYLASLGEVVI